MSPEEFLQFANLLPDAMLLVSGDGEILAANRCAGTRLGIASELLTGRQFSDLFAEQPARATDYLLSCSRTRQMIPGSLTLAPAAGDPIPCRADGAVVRPRSEAGPALVLVRLIPKKEAPTQFALLTRQIEALNAEIAQRKRVEDELRQQREWLHVTLSSIGDGVIATDQHGCVLFLNGVAQSLTGWPQNEAFGQPLEQVFHIINQQTRARVEDPVTRVLREGGVVGLANDTVLISRDGREWPIADSGAPIRDAAGHVRGVVLVFLEITERREMEAALRGQAQELREANRRKDEYIAMLAHELRNPLGAVSNALVILEQAAPGTAAYGRAQEIARRQIRHQTRMVDDLLDVSRLSRGTFELRRERVDLVEVCRHTVEDHRDHLESAGLTLSLTLPAESVWVEGDPARLSQVLANLLMNAAKFTPAAGRVIVQLQARAESDDAILSVSDTGVGIGSALLSKIFEPFTQAEQTLARTRGGLGLGLALVKGLVELHGGRVEAESPGAGQGALFRVVLPLADDSPTRAAAPASEHSAGGPLRVLVIEDLPDAAETLRDMLELWGYAVEIALTGPEGVDAARRFRPDVVLCDLGLPAMDGYAVARQLRRDPFTASAQLIAVTGYGGEEDRRRSAAAGFDAHITKPVDTELLRRHLAAIAERGSPSGR